MIQELIGKIKADFYCSLSFFSRLPVYRLYHVNHHFSFARAIWTWPFTAAFIGGLEGMILSLLHLTSLNTWITAFIGFGFHLLLTGGLHEDGLADCADGFGGGKTISQKLTIMKDSRLGSYGVLTLFTVLGIQTSSVANLLQNHQPIIPLMITTAIISRTAIFIPLFFLEPVNAHGTAYALKNITPLSYMPPVGVALTLCLFLVPWKQGCLYFLVAFVTGLILNLVIHQQTKGYNGDMLGAVQVLTATVILITSTLFP